MDQKGKTYLCIDLKSFYASVECSERGLDPLDTNLVVADSSRTEKTICLAVSPSLKAYGIPGRARLFEVVQSVREVNAKRRAAANGREPEGASFSDAELKQNPSLALSYITATPRMALYMDYSSRIYGIYLRHVAPEDIHVYSVDEVFIDATDYLRMEKKTAEEFARMLILEVLRETGITATAGIGTNLYLAKVAMDIVSKHIPADANGVRIASLNERSYRRKLWTHQPITDFWRVGQGYRDRLEKYGMRTMGDVALCSVRNQDLLYRLFGVNAELLIDHAWGYEPCTIREIKGYRAESRSLSSGQVLREPTPYETARLNVLEMVDALSLDLVEQRLVTDRLVLTLGYDSSNLRGEAAEGAYAGETKTDRYGRKVPKEAHGTTRLEEYTSSTKKLLEAARTLIDRIADKNMLYRRLNVCVTVIPESDVPQMGEGQLSIFDLDATAQAEKKKETEAKEKERRAQEAIIGIKNKYGKNAVLKVMNLEDGATMQERNGQIGGHKA